MLHTRFSLACSPSEPPALLYLVTEELLVDAHEANDTPLLTAMFFVGFLALFVLESN